MPAPKKVSATQLVKAAVGAAMGESRAKLVANHAIPERLARALIDVGIGREEFTAAVEVQLRAAALESLAEYRQALRDGRISPNSLAIGTGIMLDKIDSLSSRTPATVEPVSVRIDGKSLSRAEVLVLLTGKRGHGEPISAVPSGG